MRKLHTEIRFTFHFFILALALMLTGCVTGSGYKPQQTWPQQKEKLAAAEKGPKELSAKGAPEDTTTSEEDAIAEEALEDSAPPVKVAILLPLSGQHANLGESMLHAAEMAIFDIGDSNFELMPRDTQGTPDGAIKAAQDALQDGAKLILGPVFANEVKAVQRVAQGSGTNIVAFSTDWTLANRNTFLIGFLPFDQVERVVRYATASGYKRIGVLSPSDAYGNAVVSAFETISRPAGVTKSRVERLPQIGTQYPAKIRTFANFESRKTLGGISAAPFDAVLLPLGGNTAKQVSSLMNESGLNTSSVKRLGTGLMDDPALASDPTLEGSWFAAPSPQSRARFEQRYGSTYGVKPMRLASLAYDAAALAAVLARNATGEGKVATFDHTSITNPNGFSGVDGIFRFRQDGISERGLAILEYKNGSITIIDEAPDTFQRQDY